MALVILEAWGLKRRYGCQGGTIAISWLIVNFIVVIKSLHSTLFQERNYVIVFITDLNKLITGNRLRAQTALKALGLLTKNNLEWLLLGGTGKLNICKVQKWSFTTHNKGSSSVHPQNGYLFRKLSLIKD